MYNYDKVNLDKAMYACGNFTKALEELDPSDKYEGTSLESLDAFERQLKRFDIKIKGSKSDRVEKFYQSSQSAVLFPEFIARTVKQGMDEANHIPDIVATVTKINGLDYRTITSVPSEDDKTLMNVAEGAVIPQTVIKTQDSLVKLFKRGRMLVSSYEAIRYQRLDLFAITLRQIGAYIAKSQLADAVNVIIDGDGNNNSADVISLQSDDALTYTDLLNLWSSLSPYEMNVLIVGRNAMHNILNMDEFKNPLISSSFQQHGELITPFGATIIKCDAMDPDQIIGIDKRCALEMVSASDITIEYDKVIDRQLNRAAITSTTGFAKIFTDASKVLE